MTSISKQIKQNIGSLFGNFLLTKSEQRVQNNIDELKLKHPQLSEVYTNYHIFEDNSTEDGIVVDTKPKRIRVNPEFVKQCNDLDIQGMLVQMAIRIYLEYTNYDPSDMDTNCEKSWNYAQNMVATYIVLYEFDELTLPKKLQMDISKNGSLYIDKYNFAIHNIDTNTVPEIYRQFTEKAPVKNTCSIPIDITLTRDDLPHES